MIRSTILGLLTVHVLASMTGCGGTASTGSAPDAIVRPDPASGPSWCDWAELDWVFDRTILARAFLFKAHHQDDPRGDYLQAVTFSSDLDSLGLAEFLALDRRQQSGRRALATARWDQARELERTLRSLWNRMRDNPRAFYQGYFALPADAEDDLTEALGHLVTAAGLDPSRPALWYDLAALAGTAGDRDLQSRALEAGLAALDAAPGGSDPDRVRDALHRRLLLDLAWSLRDRGRFAECLETVASLVEMMRNDEAPTPEHAREAVIIRGLALAGIGRTDEARGVANRLAPRRLPRRKPWILQDSEMSRAIDKRTLEPVETDGERRWVRAVALARLGFAEQALAQLGEADFRTELPAHLNFRFWNDMGLVHEQFGEMARARLCYTLAAIHRPLFIHYPLVGARGSDKVFGQPGTGQIYYLGYRDFYLCGSLYSYAANRVVAMELTDDDKERRRYGLQALAGLDDCLRRNINPLSSLVLRGRTHYRLGAADLAEQDLLAAAGGLRDAGREDPDALLLLGILRFDRKDYRGCLPWLARYCELKPEEALGWRLLGLAQIHAGRLDEALATLDHALGLDPDSAVGHYNRGLLYLQVGKREAALEDLRLARRLWPENREILDVLARIQDAPRAEVHIVTDEIELTISSADSLALAGRESASPLNLVSGLGTGDGQDTGFLTGMDSRTAEYMVGELAGRYRADPTAVNRAAYALCLLQADRPLEVRALLSPLWNSGIGPEELLILLAADRALGLPARAVHLAGTLAGGSPAGGGPDLWELVAIICLENDEPAAARLAVRHALLIDPANTALQGLWARLAAGP